MLEQCGHGDWNLISSNPTVTVTNNGSGNYGINFDGTTSNSGTFTDNSIFNTSSSAWTGTVADFNSSGQKTDQTTLSYANGVLTSDLKGLNSSGGTVYEQTSTDPLTGEASATITGQEGNNDLSNSSISFAAGTQQLLMEKIWELQKSTAFYDG